MKVVIINPKNEPDLHGLKKYLEPYKKVTFDERKNHVRITCPDNFVNAIISLVEKYGYWASEYGDPENYQ